MERHEHATGRSSALDEVTGALATLSAALDGEEDFDVLLQQVCEQVTRAVPGVDEATVTVLLDRPPRTANATSARVLELDRNQYERGTGPCLEAARTGTLVRLTVAEAAHRWPDFGEEARAAGFGSIMSVPLIVENRHAGGINCYGSRDHGFAEVDGQLLELYTTAAEAALRAHRRYVVARRTTADLRAALTSRAVIDQAKGIIMAVRQIDADQAFAVLAEQSQRENVRLREVAERFVLQITGSKT